MGLILIVESFLGELPFFMLADRIVNRIGSVNSILIVLTSFSIRYLCYAHLITAASIYYVLLVELLQGPTFGLFYCVMTKIGHDYAVKSVGNHVDCDESRGQIEATMQAIMSACFEGLGLGLGAIVAGFTIDYVGLRALWSVGACIAAITGMIYLAIIRLTRERSKEAIACCTES